MQDRILLGYGVAVILITSAIGFALWAADGTADASRAASEAQASADEADAVLLAFERAVASHRAHLLTKDPDAKATYEWHYTAFESRARGLLRNTGSTETRDALDAAIGKARAYEDVVDRSHALLADGDADAAWALDAREGLALASAVTEQLDLVASSEHAAADAAHADAASALASLPRVVAVATLGAAVLAIGTGIVISTRATRDIMDILDSLADSSTLIAASVEAQEDSAAQQASSVNETTVSMSELAASSQQSDDQAEKAAHAAREALTLAESGTEKVERTLASMHGLKEKMEAVSQQILLLSEHTNQIGSVTNLVGDLANQTNMLALNAAVEASRAGEHGKGFAVVAAEIRKLADQSKQSVERISSLVTDVQKATDTTVMATEEGMKTVEQVTATTEETAELLQGVAGASNTSFEQMQQISLNAKQQATAIQQVVQAMDRLNEVTQDAAESVHGTKASLRKLEGVASGLRTLA